MRRRARMANIAAKKGASLKMARDVQRKKIKFSAPKSLLSPKNVYSKYSGVDDKTVVKRVCLMLMLKWTVSRDYLSCFRQTNLSLSLVSSVKQFKIGF